MKRTVLIAVMSVALALLGSLGAAAQDNKKSGKDSQDRWKAEKIAFLTDAMDLTPAEAEKFWPVYNKAEGQRRESWKAVMDAYKALQEAVDSGKDEKEIAALLDKYLSAQQSGKDIDSKYVKEFKKILSSRKVAKLYIGEETFRRMQIHKLNRGEGGKGEKK